MIFRTITNDAGVATRQLSLFSKSFVNIKRDMSTRQGFGYSLFGNSIKSNDVTAINNYANALKNGASVGEAWRTTMTGTSVAAKQYVLDARKAGKSTTELTQGLNNMTLGAKASTAAMKALGVAKNIALNVGVMLLITGITKAIDALVHAQERAAEKAQEAARETSEQAEKSTKAVESLIKLKTQLAEGSKSSDELTSAFKEQLKAMGYTEEQIDTLIAKYGGLAGAMDEATRKALEKARTDAHTDVATSGKSLETTYDPNGMFGDTKSTVQLTEFDPLRDEILEIMKPVAIDTDSLMSTITMGANSDSAEDIYAYYQGLQQVVQLIQETASKTNNEELLNSSVYKEASETLKELGESAKLYGDAISRLHSADAKIELADYLKTNDINSKEAFDSYIKGIQNSTEYSDAYKQVLIDVANDAFPQFSNAAKDAGENANKMTVSFEGVTKTLSTLQGKYNELKSAQDEYNSTGAISAETMQKLIDNDLLQYLDYSSGKLKINTEALLAEGEAAKVSAIQSLQKAMADDLMLLAEGKITEASPRAQKAVENLGIEMEGAGNKAKTSAGLLAGWAVSAQAAKDAAQGKLKDGFSVEDFNIQANAIISAYTSAANSIGGVTIKSPKSSSSGSSSDKNEALDNYLKYAEDLYKVHQDELKYIHDIQWGYDNLTKTDEERLEIAQDIEEARKNYAENRIKDIEHEIELLQNLQGEETDVLEHYKEIQRIAHEEANRLRELGYDNNSNEVQDWQKKWWDAEKEMLNWRFTNSQNWIDERNRLGDWHLWGDSEINAWERVLKWLREDYPHAIDEIKEAEEKLYDARKEAFKEATDFGSSYLDSKKNLLQSHYDVTNSIAEAQHEINKELKASMTMYEYLDEETRKLLFNQEDYNVLSAKLNGIQAEANRLQSEYTDKLQNATIDNLEEITSHYEMQYETLMKSYEIAKADLEVAKKKQKLNNVLNERNVRMLINGQWTWVANTQDVIDAQNELAEAEYERNNARLQLEQTNSMNALTAQQDKLKTTISQFDRGVITLNDAVGRCIDAFGVLPTSIQNALSRMNGVSASGGAASSSSSSYSGGGSSGVYTGYGQGGGYWTTATLPGGGTKNAWIDGNNKTQTSLPVGSVVHTSGGDYEITGGTAGNYSSVEVDHKHASGTRYTPGGNTLLGEIEPEMFIDNNGHLIPINQPTIGNIGAGGIVFNQDQMANMRSLWDLSNVNMGNISSILTDRVTTKSHGGDNVIHGDIHVHQPHDYNDFVRQLTQRIRQKTV